MPRCLITGASGFVGSNLAANLGDLGWKVRCLVRPTSQTELLRPLGAELVEGTLADRESLVRAATDVDFVFHLAGRLRALCSSDFDRDNVEGTRNMAQACAEQPRPPVLVYVSSLAAGGPAIDRAPREETDQDQPISNYGRSKWAGERAAAELAADVPLSIVRPPIIFGQADRASLSIFVGVKRLHLHLVPSRRVPGCRRFPVSLVHVSDLCDALRRVAESGTRVPSPSSNGDGSLAAGTYYVAAERTISYGELGRLAASAIGTSALVLPLPKFAFWLAGGICEGFSQVMRKPLYLNLDKIREAMATGWVCSDEKIRKQLNYQPAAPLEQRFAETVDWYREHGWI